MKYFLQETFLIGVRKSIAAMTSFKNPEIECASKLTALMVCPFARAVPLILP